MNQIPVVAASQEVFKGRVFSVRTDELRYADGKTHRVDVVRHRGSYAIIATPSENALILVQQYRHPAKRALWEIPAGVSEEHEEFASGALRELREETGYHAASMRALGSFFVTPGFCDEVLHFYNATQLSAGPQDLDEDEQITVASFTLEEAERLVHTGEIADAKTLIALLWMRGPRSEIVP